MTEWGIPHYPNHAGTYTKTYFVETHAFVRDISVEIGQNIDEMGQKVEESEVLGTI